MTTILSPDDKKTRAWIDGVLRELASFPEYDVLISLIRKKIQQDQITEVELQELRDIRKRVRENQ